MRYRWIAALGIVAAAVAGCSTSGTPVPDNGLATTTFATSASAVPATPVDPAAFRRSDDLYLVSSGGAGCGIGRNLPTGELGNLTCHLPAGAIAGLNPPTIDIDPEGIHAAAWPMWSGNITELLPGQSVSVGTATCTASAGPRLRCQNRGGWVDSGATGTQLSMPPAPLTTAHGGSAPGAGGGECTIENSGHRISIYEMRNTSCAEARPIITRYLSNDRVVPVVPAGSSADAHVDDWLCYIGDNTDRPRASQAATCTNGAKFFRAQ